MKKIIFYLIIFVFQLTCSQENTWKGYFSYNEITDLQVNTSKLVASTKNAVITRDLDNNVAIYNSITGLKTDEITAVFIASNNVIFIGNKNGLINIITPDGKSKTKSDIILEVPVPPNTKKINDIYEHNGKIYLATQYGISVINLANFEIESTYYIGNSGEALNVKQVTVFNNEIYAVTETQGIKKANVNSTTLFDFSQWSVFNNSTWISLVVFNNQLIGMNTDNNTYRFVGPNTQYLFSHGVAGLKLRTQGNYLSVTSVPLILVYDINFNQLHFSYIVPNVASQLSSCITFNNKTYIGTFTKGLYETTISNGSPYFLVSPNGPLENYSFKIRKTPTDLWLTHGGYDNSYAPNYKNQGISIFNKNNGWEFVNTNVLQNALSLGTILENPLNPTEVFVCSNHSGLLKITNKTNISLLNNTNSGLESLVDPNSPGFVSIRTNSLKFDKNNNLWLTNANINNGLKILNPDNTCQNTSMTTILVNAKRERYGAMDIDKNGTKWFGTFESGVIGFNEKYNNKFIKIDEDFGMPDKNVKVVVVDKKNQLWIGTNKGLRIINNIDKFVSENEITATNIVIQEGDLAQELFYQQVIQDIVVDGANNKWISLADAGVFLVSNNGQKTLQRFTKENSPLPSNTILDIEIDEATGEVFFATDKGLVSFKGTATKGSENLENAYIFPNPVRPDYTGTVKISGLMDKVNVKVTDIEGNLVYETTSQGGTVEWDTTAFGKYKVASGVYMVFVASNNGEETTVKKVMIIR